MQIGQFKIASFVEQKFKLDGGSIFGIIPRMMWEKLITLDKNNLIPMVTHIFVLKAHGKNIIFDAIVIEDRQQKIIIISFRSVGDFSVNDFARNHFNVGGHTNAAGGRSD